MKTLADLDKPTVGHPLEIIVPTEAFIPVYVPGDPSNHKGGFILLDSHGNPVRKRYGSDQAREMMQGYKASVSQIASGLIEAAQDGFTAIETERIEARLLIRLRV